MDPCSAQPAGRQYIKQLACPAVPAGPLLRVDLAPSPPYRPLQAVRRHESLPAADRESPQEVYTLQKARLQFVARYLIWCAAAVMLLEHAAMCFPEAFAANAGLWAARVENICATVYPLVLAALTTFLFETLFAFVGAG